MSLYYTDINKLEKSPLKDCFDAEEALLSAKIHHAARAFNEGRALYPRFFRRLNEIVERLNELAKERENLPTPMVPFEGLDLYDYAHVDLYLWLDAKSVTILTLIREDSASNYGNFARGQKEIAYELLEAWKPKVIICPYSKVRRELECFCKSHRKTVNFQALPNSFERVTTAETMLPWGPVLIIVCQNLLGTRNNVGVSSEEFPKVKMAIAEKINGFLTRQS